MIRINLLSEGRRPVVARKAKPTLSLGGQDPNNMLLVAGIVLGLLAAGGWWWIKNSQLSEVQGRVRSARAEFAELEPIIRQVEEFKLKQEDLERKVAIIKDLKEKQKGPVAVMDRVSRALPDLVWLDRLTVTDDRVALAGKAFNANAVAAFIENIDRVDLFMEPDTRNVRKSVMSGNDVYSFQLSFNYKLTPLATEEALEEGGDELVAAGP